MSNYFCRLCLINSKPEESSLFSKEILEMLEYCMPEFDVTLVNNPIICGECQNLLKISEKFKRKCMEVQEHIKTFKSSSADSNEKSNNIEPVNKKSPFSITTSNLSTDSFYESYTKLLKKESKVNCQDGELLKSSCSIPQVVCENNGDELLCLLDNSVNTQTSPKKTQNHTYSNFYDDNTDISVELESTENTEKASESNQKSKSIKIKSSVIDSPLDVKWEKTFCRSCNVNLLDIRGLISHLYTVHQKDGELYICLLCRYKSSDYKGIKGHYNKVHKDCIDLKASCIFCMTHMKNFEELCIHMRNEHSFRNKTMTFLCNSCDFSSKSFDNFKKHFFRSHDFICNYCLKVLESIEAINRHIGCHSGAFKKKNSFNIKTD